MICHILKMFRRVAPLLFILTCGVGSAVAQVATLEATFSLTRINNVTVPYQNGMPVPSFEKQKRWMVSLAGTWRKLRFTADHDLSLRRRDSTGYAALVAEAGNRFSPHFNDSGWETKAIPGVENTMNAYQQTPEYYEDGIWYRYRFSLSDSLQDKFARLKFLAVNYVADVWLNGVYLGWHEGGYTPFAFDATPALRFDSANVLAVRVDNIPWNPRQYSGSGRIDIVPYYKVDWFNYAGIMHDVYLEFTEPVSIARADVVPLDVNGDVKATIVVQNASSANQDVTVSMQVYHAAIDSTNIQTENSYELIGTPAIVLIPAQASVSIAKDSCSVWQTAFKINNPELWSPQNPHLYVLKVTLTAGGKVVDEFATQFGVRTVKTSGRTFLLNEHPIFFPGIARHEDHPTYGRSLPKNVIYSDLKIVKELPASLLRTAHYPNNPYTYLIADRLGLAIMEEIPVWWFDIDAAWFIQNSFRNIHTQMWREMIFKDYNRPSVILWSTCNECLVVSGRRTFITNVNRELDAEYPDGRLVTQSAAADRPGPQDPSQYDCDVAGWTMYFGVFHGSTPYYGTKQFLLDVLAIHNKPVIDTEFGVWSTESGAEESRQVMVFDSTLKAFSEFSILNKQGNINPFGFLMGITWWTVFDWYTSQQAGGFQSMGIYHMDRKTPKQVTSVLRAAYKPYYDNSEPLTGVEKEQSDEIPREFMLGQNYPNPFNPTTTIEFSVGTYGHTSLQVFNVLGQEVATLVNGEVQAGRHQVQWDANGMPSGIYLYQLRVGNFVQKRKMVLIR